MQRDILQKWYFERSPSEVWEYLTKPELIEQWLMKTDFQPVVGFKFQFTYVPKEGSKYKGAVDCEVLEVRPFTKLSYSWNGATMDGSRTFNSKVEWTLLPKDKGTELQLKHNGFVVLEDLIAHEGGWGKCLERLGELLKTN